MIDRPTTKCVAPSATALSGVTIRRWSPASSPASRIPGVTSKNPSRCLVERTAASAAEQTTPSRPVDSANAANWQTRSMGSSSQPSSARSSRSMLVSTVTPTSRGGCDKSFSASFAARIILDPPEAWTLTIHTPNSAAALTALATVVGIS